MEGIAKIDVKNALTIVRKFLGISKVPKFLKSFAALCKIQQETRGRRL